MEAAKPFKIVMNILTGFQSLFWIGAFIFYVMFGNTIAVYDDVLVSFLGLSAVASAVLLLIIIFSIIQKCTEYRHIREFQNLLKQNVLVVRSGVLKTIDSSQLVVGDLIQIGPATFIPADVRIIRGSDLQCDESIITGEIKVKHKSQHCTTDHPIEAGNLAFSGTYLVQGNCQAIVIRTGDETLKSRADKSFSLESNFRKHKSSLSSQLLFFNASITWLGIFFSIILFVNAFVRKYHWMDALLFLTSTYVAVVPQSLLAVLTVSLTICARQMAAKNCLVKHLEVLEKLASVSVIITDQEQTITKYEPKVAHVWYDNILLDADSRIEDTTATGLRALVRCAVLNCAQPVLDRTERAVLTFCESLFGSFDDYRKQNPCVHQITYQKCQVSIHETNDGDSRYLVLIRGSPENLLKYSNTINMDGSELKLSDYWRNQLIAACEQVGNLGERVYGMADFRLDPDRFPRGHKFDQDDTQFMENYFRLLGFVSTIEQLRPGITNAVSELAQAGVKVVMVTKSPRLMAQQLARKIGLFVDIDQEEKGDLAKIEMSSSRVINGHEMEQMETSQFDDLIEAHSEIVFAQLEPRQKLTIVESFQRLGKIVAVTGEGSNDVPAFRKADVAIANGISGNDASKQASDLILLDDNLSSIVNCIHQARLMIENLRKSVAYMLFSNLALFLPVLLVSFGETPLPLSVVTMIYVHLITNILPPVSLAFEPAERKSTAPVNLKQDRLIDWRLIIYSYGQIGLIQALSAITVYFLFMASNGFRPESLILVQTAWNNRSHDSVLDSKITEWTFVDRKKLEYASHHVYLVAMVILQIAALITSRTRQKSIFKHSIR